MKPAEATLGYYSIVPFCPPKIHCTRVPFLPEKTPFQVGQTSFSMAGLRFSVCCFSIQADMTVRSGEHNPLWLFIYGFICLFWDKVSLVAPRWTWTHYVGEYGLKLPAILLCQPPRRWDHGTYKYVRMYACMHAYVHTCRNFMYTMRNFQNPEVMLECFLADVSWKEPPKSFMKNK